MACSAIRGDLRRASTRTSGTAHPRVRIAFTRHRYRVFPYCRQRRRVRTVRTDVTFVSNGLTPTGHLHPPDSRAGHPLPAIVVGEPWGSGADRRTPRPASDRGG